MCIYMVELESELGLAEADVNHVTTTHHRLTREILFHEVWMEASQSFPCEYKPRESLHLDMKFSPVPETLFSHPHSLKTFQKVPMKLKVLFQLLLLHNTLPQDPAA